MIINQCSEEIHSIHCNGQHYSSDKYCSETAILETQMKERISRSDAMNKVFQSHPEYEDLYAHKYTPPLTDNNGSQRTNHPSSSEAPPNRNASNSFQPPPNSSQAASTSAAKDKNEPSPEKLPKCNTHTTRKDKNNNSNASK